LAIGLEGGFDPSKKKFEIKETHQIVILPDFITIPWPSDNLPEKVSIVNFYPETKRLSHASIKWHLLLKDSLVAYLVLCAN